MNRIYQLTLIGALLLVVAITTIPYANAFPDHTQRFLPNPQPTLGSTITLVNQVDPNPTTYPIVMPSLRVYEDANNLLTVGNTANCANDLTNTPPTSGGRIWELQDSTSNNPVKVTHLAGISHLQIVFGDGGAANPSLSDNMVFDPAPGNYVWKELTGNPNSADDLNVLGLHKFASCGFEDLNANGVFDAGDLPATIVESFIVTTVGGTILDTNAAALFIAGAAANTYVILPILGGIAGAIIGITKALRWRFKDQ